MKKMTALLFVFALFVALTGCQTAQEEEAVPAAAEEAVGDVMETVEEGAADLGEAVEGAVEEGAEELKEEVGEAVDAAAEAVEEAVEE